MNQLNLIPEIQRLCDRGEYDAAIELTNEIDNNEIAVKAHLLCMEHEQSRIKEKKQCQT